MSVPPFTRDQIYARMLQGLIPGSPEYVFRAVLFDSWSKLTEAAKAFGPDPDAIVLGAVTNYGLARLMHKMVSDGTDPETASHQLMTIIIGSASSISDTMLEIEEAAERIKNPENKA